MLRIPSTPKFTMACLWVGTAFFCPALVRAQQVLNLGFEARDTFFQAGPATGPVTEQSHRITEESYHGGQRSEEIKITLTKPTYVPYYLDIGKAPITEELALSVWMKANKPGISLLCRVVLPRERDPQNPDRAMTAVIQGDSYQLSGRWQQISVRQPPKKLREQQQILQHELKREISVVDAYVDRIIVNVGVGPGPVELNLDDLEAGPLSESRAMASAPAPGGASAEGGGTGRMAPGITARRISEVQVRGNQLVVAGQKFFLRGIRYTGTPLKTLRDAGFNTIWIDESTPQGILDEAVTQGFWVVPGLAPLPMDQTTSAADYAATLTGTGALGKKMGRFLEQDAVLGWNLGSNLLMEKAPQTARLAQAYRGSDPHRPVFVDVADGFSRYARGIDQLLLGVHRFPMGTTLELQSYRDWIMQKRNLTQDGVYTWTWVQAHPPEWTVSKSQQENGTNADPVGPSPEQIRLLTYTALASGVKGIGFWSDSVLADNQAGRDRLLQMALLNQELQLLEPVLLAAEKPLWIDTSHADVKAAVLRSEKSILVLPIWMGKGTQCVPPQGALPSLSMVIPAIPAGMQAWEVGPGQVRSLKWTRVTGGYRIELKEFALTASVVFTSDLTASGLVVRFQDLQRKMVPIAAQWAIDLAGSSIDRTARVYADLEAAGHGQPDGPSLITKARAYWESARSHFNIGQHQDAYQEAMRAMRPLRILHRACWDEALKDFDNLAATPYLAGFFSLPAHYQWIAAHGGLKSTENLLREGDFETPAGQSPQGWMMQSDIPLDDVVPVIQRSRAEHHSGGQCLELRLDPKDPKFAPVALERAFLAIHSPDIKLPPQSWVKISAWIKIPLPLQGSVDGALFYDSAMGETLAFRATGTPGWRKVTLYRQVPASGKIHAVVATTAMGSAYFDDITIEPILTQAGTPASPVVPNNPGNPVIPINPGNTLGSAATGPANNP